jgi:hypothetical protein
LAYANAVLPEALIAAGDAVDDRAAVDDGLRLLGWLVQTERLGDHFSFTPTGGRGRDDPRPGFDQQPIEPGAVADACARACDVTGDAMWIEPVLLAAGWFQGRNDVGVSMFDPGTGGGFDGLHADGVNENQGAESTIVLITALQQARRVGTAIVRTSQPDAASASSS